MGIYKITNKINGKCYIGQSVDIQKRWREHTHHAKKGDGYAIHNAIAFHGVENFNFEVVEIVDKKEKLTDREIHWYNKLKPKYNIAFPGANSNVGFEVCQIDIETYKVVATYANSIVAGEITNVYSSTIRAVCTGKCSTAKGYYWCYKKDLKTWKPKPKKPHVIPKGQSPKPVNQINIKTNQIIKTWDSAKEAADVLGLSRPKISNVCTKQRKSHGGFGWTFVENL